MSTTTRKPSSIRRREIAEATLQVIGERGATSLTAARLAEEVGMTSGALFRHFASVDEILSATADLAIEALEETFPAPELPSVERLRTLALRRIELIGGKPGLSWLLLSDQVYLCVPKDAVGRLRKLVQRSRIYLLRALREGIAAGDLRSDLDPEQMLPIFTGTVHSLILARSARHRARRASTRASAEQVIDALLALLAAT